MSTTERRRPQRQRVRKTAAEVLEFAAERGVEMVDLKFVDLPGTWQHMTLPLGALDADDFESGLGFDGSSIRGFQEIHESDMLLIPDADDRVYRPVLHACDAVADLLDRGSRAGRALWTRSALRRAEGRAAPDPDRGSPTSRTSAPRRSSSSSTTSPTSRSSTAPSTRSTRPRASGTPGRPAGAGAEPRLQAAPEGGLLPGPAGRLARQPAQRDGRDDGVARDPLRVPSPRGLLGRPGRDRHALPAAAADGRPDDDLQVRGQERRRRPPARPRPSCPSRSSRRTAPACTCTSRCGRTASR